MRLEIEQATNKHAGPAQNQAAYRAGSCCSSIVGDLQLVLQDWQATGLVRDAPLDLQAAPTGKEGLAQQMTKLLP